MGIDIAGIGSIADLIKTGIDKIWPDKTEVEKTQMALMMAQLQGELDLAKWQSDVNKTEAASSSIFVAGWRPFIGWTCGAGLAMQFVVSPIGVWISGLCGKTIQMPNLDMGTLLTLLFGMLGMSGLRTFEKIKVGKK